MNAPENQAENTQGTEVSTQTTRRPSGFLQRAVWTSSLMVIGSVLAIHAALAYSPDLARFVPDGLIKSAATVSASSCQAGAAGGCHSNAFAAGDFGGCCSMRVLEQPLLTDGLYREEELSDAYAEAPADAAECVPAKSATTEAAEPQAGTRTLESTATDSDD